MLVIDNLNIHGIASLYEAFDPRRRSDWRSDWRSTTPQARSGLNIAEIELSALTRQCLDRRIEDLTVLNAELAAWQQRTYTGQRQVDWHFNDRRCTSQAASSVPELKTNLSSGNLLGITISTLLSPGRLNCIVRCRGCVRIAFICDTGFE